MTLRKLFQEIPSLMSKQMIDALKPGEPVDAPFMVVESSLRGTRAGGAYLALTLADRTGQIQGRLWDATEAFAATILPEEIIQVKGRAESYQNQLQLNIRAITKPEPETLRLGDFLPQCPRDPVQMARDLTALLATIQEPHLKALVDSLLADKEFMDSFRTAPAAVVNHHAYLGGLMEHTLAMMQMALRVCEQYPQLRRDLLLTGAFIHDIGKTRELTYHRAFRYSVPGNLVGHITIGVMMLDEHARKLPDFPPQTLNMLSHMILSHHGQYDFGSPKLPHVRRGDGAALPGQPRRQAQRYRRDHRRGQEQRPRLDRLGAQPGPQTL